MKPFISIIPAFKKTILLLYSVVALSLALFSSCAFAAPLQQTTLNTEANVSIDSTIVQTKTPPSSLSIALLNDLCDGSITKSHMFNLVSHQVNKDNQDSKTTILSANNQPINLDTASDTETIGYMLNYYKGFCYTYFYYDVNKFVNDINNVSDADVYLSQDIVLNKTIEIKDNAKITIHLQGHVLSGKNIGTFWSSKQVIEVKKGANLTVIGSENDTQANQVHTLSGFNKNGEMKNGYIVCGGVITAGQKDDVLGIKITGNISTITLNDTTLFGCSDKEGEGAGIDISGKNTELYLNNSRITHCRADSGGGLCIGEGSFDSFISMNNSSIDNNHADGNGAGIYIDGDYSYIRMTNSSIDNNHADDYGGGIYHNSGGATIDDTAYYITDSKSTRPTISNNEAGNDGGGIYSNDSGLNVNGQYVCNNIADNGGGAYLNSGNNFFSGCIFTDNKATDNGGGACVDASNNTLRKCTFTNNEAETGGGIRINHMSNNTSVSSCSFYGNHATENGGGVDVISYQNTFDECTFTGNTSIYAGSALYDNGPRNILKNCTITDNTSKANLGAVYVCSTVKIMLDGDGIMYIMLNIGYDVYLKSYEIPYHYTGADILLINSASFNPRSYIVLYIDGPSDKKSRIKSVGNSDKIDEFIIDWCFYCVNETWKKPL